MHFKLPFSRRRLSKPKLLPLLYTTYGFLFSNCKHLALQQHKKASKFQINNPQSHLDPSNTLFHRLYRLVICLLTFRVMLAAATAHFTINRKYVKENEGFLFFWWDATLSVFFTSVSFFRNATMLLCMSLMAVSVLTVDWLLSEKYACLFFRQAYDLLVINNSGNTFFSILSNQFKYVKFKCLKNELKILSIRELFRIIGSIWNGRQLLPFSIASNLPHFDRSTCTQEVRGRALLTSAACEVLASWHLFGASRKKLKLSI